MIVFTLVIIVVLLMLNFVLVVHGHPPDSGSISVDATYPTEQLRPDSIKPLAQLIKGQKLPLVVVEGAELQPALAHQPCTLWPEYLVLPRC